MQKVFVSPILPAGLAAVQSCVPAPIEAGAAQCVQFARAHRLQMGIVGGQLRLHLPSELFGFFAPDFEAALTDANRVCAKYRFAVALLTVEGDEMRGVLRVNP
jgi:hypothetical protein